MTTFVPLRGQYDNIGDIILRRQLGRWLEPDSSVYVGHAPADFVAGLELDPSMRTHTSFRHWVRELTRAERAATYVFKPGEIQLSAPGMKEHLGMLPALALVRARGGKVARVGVGARGDSRVYALACSPSVRLSELSWWRDEETTRVLRKGRTIPDLAFGEGTATADWSDHRPRMAVSLRGDLPTPDGQWLAGVRGVAHARGLGLIAVSQVRRDDERTRWLARELDCEALEFGDRDMVELESDLRAVYAESALIVSNRLHVLIAGITEGAKVSAAVPGGSAKVQRHLDAVGLENVAFDTSGCEAALIQKTMETLIVGQTDPAVVVDNARIRLRELRSEFSDVMYA